MAYFRCVAVQEAPTEWGLGFLRTCSPRDLFPLLHITHPLVRGRAPVKESSQSWDDAPARQSPPLIGGGPFPSPLTGGSRYLLLPSKKRLIPKEGGDVRC